MTDSNHGYGWRPDTPDARDQMFAAPRPSTPLPPRVNLTPHCPPVLDQGQLGSCTANAIANAIRFDLRRQGVPDAAPSRLFVYYNERAMEGTVDSDAGAMIRDGIKSVAHQGVCPESLWPYDVAKWRDQPPPAAYAEGLKHRAVSYQRVGLALPAMKACLAAGFPFVFGFTVYESFESDAVAKTGTAPMPQPGEAALGGHAVLAVGYDDANKTMLCQNSWGSWGLGGYFTLPQQFMVHPGYTGDVWTIRVVTA